MKLALIISVSLIMLYLAIRIFSRRTNDLLVASLNGLLGDAQRLLGQGADVNEQSEEGSTSLMFAAQQGHIEVVKLLLLKGANVNARDKNGGTALMTAADSKELVELLVENGVELNARFKDGRTALMIARENNYRMKTQALLEAGAEID